jgi:hypothetical protein
MILQAYEYETGMRVERREGEKERRRRREGEGEKERRRGENIYFSLTSLTAQNINLHQFFESTKGAFKTEQVQSWVAELEKRRQLHLNRYVKQYNIKYNIFYILVIHYLRDNNM